MWLKVILIIDLTILYNLKNSKIIEMFKIKEQLKLYKLRILKFMQQKSRDPSLHTDQEF
jgi:hypothetical protein